MTIAELILWCVVLAVGVPSAWRNPTAGALVLCYVAAKALYFVTGNSLSVEYYPFFDIFVIAVIFAKPAYRRWRPRGAWQRLQGIILDRSPADRTVIILFLAAWYFYIAGVQPFFQWYALWAISLAQFLAAGWESLSMFRRSRAVSADTHDNPGALLTVNGGGGSG